MKKTSFKLITGGIFLFASFLLVPTVLAAKVDYKLFNESLSEALVTTEVLETGVVEVTAVDLGNDGVNELVVGHSGQNEASVYLLRADGSLINKWSVWNQASFTTVNVATCDLDADSKSEILVTPGAGIAPVIKIYDTFGVTKIKDITLDSTLTSGVKVACGKFLDFKEPKILVSYIKNNQNQLEWYNLDGTKQAWTQFLTTASIDPMSIALADVNGDGKNEIIAGASFGDKPRVSIVNDKNEVTEFLVYAETFRAGLSVFPWLTNGKVVIMTAPNFGGGAHIRFFDATGKVIVSPKFFAFDSTRRDGWRLAVGNFNKDKKSSFLVVPQTINPDSNNESITKLIKVDISEQKLYAYQYGMLVKSFLVSTGRKGFDTPIGDFTVYRKRPLVNMTWFYGPDSPLNYNLKDVPDVLSFKGAYTIHGAYWHKNWGHRMSHGCVNVALDLAKWVYDWAPMGTAVRIVE